VSVAAAVRSHVGDVRRDVARRLRERGIDSPDLDARLLVGHALGLDHAGLARADERDLDQDQLAAVEALVARRLAGEPVARIIGTKEFWSLSIVLSPAVLVPRPETETVVEQALAAVDRGGVRTRALRIADLGVGSGAILLALLSELPNALGVGTDRDPAVLAVSRDNARRLGLDARAAFVACDFGAALSPGFDLVVTNPPYIASDDIAALPAEVRDFDPPRALDGGPDGLAAYRAIAADARRLLAPNAHLIAELGDGQSEAVAALFAAQGLGCIRIGADLAGVSRTITASPNP
jgi:release factor glutamine methyltransferase